MLKIGLTGGIGSGKTAVSNLFSDLGIHIIDTDVIAHELLENTPSILKAITQTFGKDVLDTNGSINRKKLAQIVFHDQKQRQLLENILHPAIRHQVNQKILKLSELNPPPRYLIVVIPLLLETGFDDLIDKILIVIADEHRRIERVKQRDDRALEEIRAIINNQVNDEKRIQAADDIIENNSDFKQLEEYVQQLNEKYNQLAGEPGK